MALPWEKYQSSEGPWSKYANNDYQPSLLEQAADVSTSAEQAVLGPVASGISKGAQFASKALLGTEAPANFLGQAMNYLPEKIEQGGEYIAEKGGELGYPKTGAVAGMVAANLPYMIPVGKGAQINTALKPFSGKPGIAARMGQMRTGVEASAFEQLRRDPTAFFLGTERQEAGQAIGEAKAKAGISLGVTDDPATLTAKNLAKARSVQAAGTKAENDIVSRIEDVLETGELPVLQPGAKEGPAHALFAYTDDFGPEMSKRNVYNVFGDPKDPKIAKRGYGSSVSKQELDELGIPVTGREPRPENFQRVPNQLSTEELVAKAKITPDEVSTALDGINARLTKLERSAGRGSPQFQKWSAIKSQFESMLETTAPEVKQANKEFSRVALRDKFMDPMPVNQAGTMSKISSFAFTPGAAGVGGLLGGIPGAIGGAAIMQGVRSPFVAGLATATRGLADKVLDPLISKAGKEASRRALYGAYIDRITTKRGQDE